MVSAVRGVVYFDKSGFRNLAIEIGKVHPHEVISNRARPTMNRYLLVIFTTLPPEAVRLFMVNLAVFRSSTPTIGAYHSCQNRVDRGLV